MTVSPIADHHGAFAPVYEYYLGLSSMQTLLVLLTIPEEELLPGPGDD